MQDNKRKPAEKAIPGTEELCICSMGQLPVPHKFLPSESFSATCLLVGQKLKCSRHHCAPTRNDEIEQLLTETNKQKIEIQAQKFHLKCFHKELGSLWRTLSTYVVNCLPNSGSEESWVQKSSWRTIPFSQMWVFSSVWSFCTKHKVVKGLLLGHHLREEEEGQRQVVLALQSTAEAHL